MRIGRESRFIFETSCPASPGAAEPLLAAQMLEEPENLRMHAVEAVLSQLLIRRRSTSAVFPSGVPWIEVHCARR